MKFRVRLDAILDVTDTETRDKVRDYLLALRAKMQRISAMEASSIVVEKCYHDEIPTKPCEVLYEWTKE